MEEGRHEATGIAVAGVDFVATLSLTGRTFHLFISEMHIPQCGFSAQQSRSLQSAPSSSKQGASCLLEAVRDRRRPSSASDDSTWSLPSPTECSVLCGETDVTVQSVASDVLQSMLSNHMKTHKK